MAKRVLIIDDDPYVGAVVSDMLEMMGHEVEWAQDGTAGISMALEGSYDLMLVDLLMPDIDGAEVTRKIRERNPEAAIVVISGHPRDPLAKKAVANGADAIVPKPFELGIILDHLGGV